MNGFEKYMSKVDEKFLLDGYEENERGTISGVYSAGGVLTNVVTAYKKVTGRTISYDEAGKYVCMEIAKRWVDKRKFVSGTLKSYDEERIQTLEK